MALCTECGRKLYGDEYYYVYHAPWSSSEKLLFCSDGCLSKYYERHKEEYENLPQKEEQARQAEWQASIKEKYSRLVEKTKGCFFLESDFDSNLEEFKTVKKSGLYDLAAVENKIKLLLHKEVSAFVTSVNEGSANKNEFPFWEKVCKSLGECGFNISEEKKILSNSKHWEKGIIEKEKEEQRKKEALNKKEKTKEKTFILLGILFFLASLLYPFFICGYDYWGSLLLLIATFAVFCFAAWWGCLPLIFYLSSIIYNSYNSWLILLPQIVFALMGFYFIGKNRYKRK